MKCQLVEDLGSSKELISAALAQQKCNTIGNVAAASQVPALAMRGTEMFSSSKTNDIAAVGMLTAYWRMVIWPAWQHTATAQSMAAP